ncbi:hypothetical protein UFOVP1336_27 [uncultured Caudovirales phage]|uniref:Uncharacterized protein n=1 Tax=uncultured Caudovirales phage TaxID=2100421 RepID=A0A6J5RZJ4_9CAUD|nr:hypothetical protein UFOVP1336_27 [uncultured Caudovirales phage]
MAASEAISAITNHILVEYASGQPRDRKGRFGATGGGGAGGGAVDPSASDKAALAQANSLYGKPDQLDPKGEFLVTTQIEKSAAEDWVGSEGYRAIQAVQEGKSEYTKRDGSKEKVMQIDQLHHQALVGLTNRATLTEDLVVSRGIKPLRGEKSALVAAADKAGIGGIIEIPKFTATTKNPMVALSFSTKQIVRITAPKGTRALDYDLIKHGLTKFSWGNENREREVLFPPGSRFRVVDIKRGAVKDSVFIDLVPA